MNLTTMSYSQLLSYQTKLEFRASQLAALTRNSQADYGIRQSYYVQQAQVANALKTVKAECSKRLDENINVYQSVA